MEYQLWIKAEKHTKGCPEDDSESSTTTKEFIIIDDKEYDSFGETIADDCGYQDYGYQVSYTKILTIKSIADLKAIWETLSLVAGKNICKYCNNNQTDSIDEDVLCEDCQECFGHSRYSEL